MRVSPTRVGRVVSRWLRRGELLTQLKAISAVDIEVVIAGLALPAERVEDKAVRAEAGLGHAVVALVVLVALLQVLVGAVGLVTDDLGCKAT